MRIPARQHVNRRSRLIGDPLIRVCVEMVAGLILGAIAGLWLLGRTFDDPVLSAALGAAIGGAVGASLFGLDGE